MVEDWFTEDVRPENSTRWYNIIVQKTKESSWFIRCGCCFILSGKDNGNRQIPAKPRKVPIKYGVSFSRFSISTPFLGKVMPKYRLSLLSKLMSADVKLHMHVLHCAAQLDIEKQQCSFLCSPIYGVTLAFLWASFANFPHGFLFLKKLSNNATIKVNPFLQQVIILLYCY